MRGMWIIDYLKKWPSYWKYQFRTAKRPYFITFNLTDTCNSKCIMCHFWKNKKRHNEITPDEIRKLLQQDVMKDLKVIGLTGGEIFMRPDIPEIIDAIYETSGVKPHIGTNGLFPSKLDKLLQTHKERLGGVMISVDGLGEVHDTIRGKGTFDITMKAIRICKDKHGTTPTINMTLSKQNYKTLVETHDYFKDYVFTYKIAKKSKLHFGDNFDMDFELDKEQIKHVLEDAKKISNKNLYDVFLDDWALHDKRPDPCYAGLTSAVVNQDGTLQPCIHKPAFGNIREEDVNSMWASDRAKTFRKKHKTCQDCYERCTVETFGIDLPKWVIKAKIKQFKERRQMKADSGPKKGTHPYV
jgi:MoaA/NifB/PqqE/SkfB family radical SAM enzyme